MGVHDPDEYAGIVRGIQDFHMDGNGWADIAYNALVSPHGQVFAGRGPNVRSAANGSNDGNAGWVAICYIAGEGDPFTEAAQAGIVAAAGWLGVADGEWKVHRDFVATACPGDEITAWVRAGHPAPQTPDQEDDLTDDEHKTLYESKDLATSTNAAVGRIETAVRDGQSGLQVQMDRLIKAVEALVAALGKK